VARLGRCIQPAFLQQPERTQPICPAHTSGPRQQPSSSSTAKQKAPKTPPGRWLSANPSKRWAELLYLAYSPFWIAWALCVLVPFQLYEVREVASVDGCVVRAPASAMLCPRHPGHLCSRVPCCWLSLCGCNALPLQHLDEWGYLLVGLAAAVPCVLLPLLLPPCKVRGSLRVP
jgi:hypothetical protein